MDLENLPENSSEIADVKLNAPVLREEPVEDKFSRIIKEQGLKNKILRYKVTFGHYLTAYDYKIQDLDNLDLNSLETLLMEIEISVSTRTSSNMVYSYYAGGVSVVEKIAPVLGMNLKGLSAVLTENKQIKETLEELSIKYDVLSYSKPEVRLIYYTLQSIMAVNTHNKKNAETQRVLDEKIDKKIVDEFKDL